MKVYGLIVILFWMMGNGWVWAGSACEDRQVGGIGADIGPGTVTGAKEGDPGVQKPGQQSSLGATDPRNLRLGTDSSPSKEKSTTDSGAHPSPSLKHK